MAHFRHVREAPRGCPAILCNTKAAGLREDPRSSVYVMSNQGSRSRDDTAARPGRNSTYAAEAYQDDDLNADDLMDGAAHGSARVDSGLDGFHQPTAMFDKGEFLGDLADLEEAAKGTRAKVEAEPAAPKGLKLIIVDGPDLGMEWQFKAAEVTLGRDEDCELMMSDIAVSRRHSKIALENDEFVLYDLESGNGTYLNGAKVTREVLSVGDEITVGERTFRFVELGEAPPTAAAHPVAAGMPAEPEFGDPADVDDFAPIGGASQLDVSVVQPEPEVGGEAPVDAGPPVKGPRRGEALRTVIAIVGALVVVAGLGVGGWIGYKRYFAGETPAQAELRSKAEFLVGVQLVKQERCGDAILMFNRVLKVRPDYRRAADYIAHCQAEVGHWHVLEQARSLAKSQRVVQALESLQKIPSDSTYADDASKLAGAYHRKIASDLVAEARIEYVGNDDPEAALSLIARALEHVPGYRPAIALRARIKKSAPAPKIVKPKARAKPRIPPQLVRAIALYKNAKLSAAIDAAEAAGGEEAQQYIAQMEQVKRLLGDASRAHHAKAAGELLRIVPAALEIDRRVAHGEGKVRTKLNRYYANALYLKGIQAYQGRDDLKAYQLLGQALRVDPKHKLAKMRRADIQARLDQIYYEAYVLKDSDPDQTRKVFRRLVKYIDKKHPVYKKAKRWLRAHGGA